MRTLALAVVAAVAVAGPGGDARAKGGAPRPPGAGHGAPRPLPGLPLGAVCSVAADCDSGFCVDGVCCDTACAGDCVVCALAGHEGACTAASSGTDPRQRCQATSGGDPACAGACNDQQQCAFPDSSASCGLCSACDGAGGCTAVPTDDDACGHIACGALSDSCRIYHDIVTDRCAALGQCKPPDDPTTCTSWSNLPCFDGGWLFQDDGGVDSGAGGGGGAAACAVAPAAPPRALGLPALLAAAVALVLGRPRRRGRAGRT